MIKIKNLNKNFKNRKLFNDFDLNIPLNKLVFIVGKSGSGKTTLLNLIGGIDKPDSGQILFESNEKPTIDFIFQDYNLFPDFNLFHNLQIANGVIGNSLDKAFVMKKMEQLNIPQGALNEKVKNLSGGEQQRVAILRTILRNSDIILADEPTGNLDVENSENIFQLLKQASINKTVIVISHDVEAAKKYSDQIIFLNDGKIESIVDNYQQKNALSLLETSNDQKKPKNKWKLLPIFGFQDIKKKWMQFFMFIILFLLSSISLATFLQLNSNSYNLIETNSTKFHTTSIRVDKKQEGKFYFQDSYIKKLEKIEGIEKILPNYGGPTFKVEFDGQQTKSALKFETIDSSDFFVKKLESNNLIEGSVIKNNNEIIISKEMVVELNISNPIGKTIKLFNNAYEPEELIIVGINQELSFNDNKPFAYLSNDFIKNVFVKNIEKFESEIQNQKLEYEQLGKKFISKKYSLSIKNDQSPIHSSFLVENVISYDGSSNIILGSFPVNPEDVIVSSSLYNKINQHTQIGDTISLSILEFGDFNIKIVGVVESKNDELLASEQTIKNFNTLRPSSLTVFAQNFNIVDMVIENINKVEPNDYHIVDVIKNIRKVFQSNFVFVKAILLLFFIIFLLFTTFILIAFSKFLIVSKTKEIGLLKNLGASGLQVLFYNLASMFITISIVLIIGTVIILPLQSIFALLIPNLKLLTINPPIIFGMFLTSWMINSLIYLLIYVLMFMRVYKKIIINILKY